MFPPRFHALTGKKWFVKLAWVMGIIGVTTMISSPVLARRFYGFAFLQPSAYRNYPYRNSNSTIADTLAKDDSNLAPGNMDVKTTTTCKVGKVFNIE